VRRVTASGPRENAPLKLLEGHVEPEEGLDRLTAGRPGEVIRHPPKEGDRLGPGGLRDGDAGRVLARAGARVAS
jgi:hypothetical protein